MAVRRTWIGWCLLLGLVASCASSGDTSGTGGTGGAGGGASGGTGGAGSGSGGATSGGGGSGGSGGVNGAAGATGGSGGGQVVGTAGGSVTQAGVTLDVPADAVPSAVTITIAPTSAPSGYTLASQAYQFGPSGTQFQQPVTVTIPLTSGTSGVHLFWSNASGGFDDVGGTIAGSTLTAQVTHFSIGFCAVPKVSNGSGGATATGGVSGASGSSGAAGAGAGGSTSSGAGGSGSGAGGSSGTAGTSGSGVAGSSGTGSAGTAGGGAAGSSGAAGASGPTDAGLSGDAAASLCKQVPLNLPFAAVHYPEAGGAAPDGSAYTGGTLVSGKSYLSSVTHYGGGTYAGTKQAQYTIDTAAQTIVIGEFVPNTPGPGQFTAMSYTVVASNTLRVTVVCNSGATPTGTFDMYYSVNGPQTTLTAIGSTDVLVIGLLNGG